MRFKYTLLAVIPALLLTGCVVQPRPVDPYTRAAIIGAAEQQALQNAHDAAYNQGAYRKHHERRDQSINIYQPAPQYDYGHRHHDRAPVGSYNHPIRFHAQAAHRKAVSYKQLTNEAEACINAPISEVAEFLIGQGWKANKGAWHKQGYTLNLIVEDGIVLNAQLTK